MTLPARKPIFALSSKKYYLKQQIVYRVECLDIIYFGKVSTLNTIHFKLVILLELLGLSISSKNETKDEQHKY